MARFRFSDGIEVRSQRNQYKRYDVFLCRQEGHRAFGSRVSVYHVLREKQCYPGGCLGFAWKCLRLNKGLSCPRGMHHVGKMCFGCKFFVDEKINYRPEVLLSPEEFDAFREELREFERWVEDHRGREVNCSGTVLSVKPHLTIDPSRSWRPSFHGFLAVIADGFVDMVHFEDSCYVRLGSRAQERYRFRPGDRVDLYGRFKEDRGRIILTGVNRVEVEHRSEGLWWNEARARVALHTGKILEGQPRKCLDCRNGCLIDVRPARGWETRSRRILFCLEGIEDPSLCTRVETGEEIREGCGIRTGACTGNGGLTVHQDAAMNQALVTR
ncbi:MAG: hypothetical protein JRH07_10765 [Deltaproteobacteria bacterium]|nr:hypothetical protein [Deltaproteobacteria bacterium]MBW2122313.1 hypothetical protein [Deltaproteobacteria bacterium]